MLNTPRRPSRLPLAALAALLTTTMALAGCGSGDDEIDAGAGVGTDQTDSDGDQTGGDGDQAGGDPAGGETSDADSASGGGATRPWIAGSWALESATQDGIPLDVPDDALVDLSITGPDQIEGNLGCNGFAGTISAEFDGDRDGGPLALTDLAWTAMACEHLDFEMTYTELLTSVDEWELAPPSGLVFRGEGIELVYGVAEQAAPAPASLEETVWRFDTIFAGEGVERTASTPDLSKGEVTAVIAGGVLTLSSEDCDPVEVAVTYEAGSEGPFTPDGVPSPAGCDDPDSNLETALAGIAESTGYQVVDGRLTLIGLPGETISFTTG